MSAFPVAEGVYGALHLLQWQRCTYTVYVYMHLVHVAVYMYVLREQGLCPVSESEFSLEPGEPNVHLFHGPWLS